ncbi:MAG: D-alanyl-D-alanine carboxypeptidase/D-alanyl-D-alanine-endopeptidase [Paracoccaceae bacterium]
MANRFLSRRTVLGGLLAGAGQSAWAGAPTTSLYPIARTEGVRQASIAAADALINKAGLGGKISLVVANASDGKILESVNPLLALPPASVAKAITAQYALDALGPEHNFSTQLIAVGTIVAGRLEGDLVLMGGGDPTLDTTALAEMAALLKATGLREVSGRFLVQSGALPHVHQIDAGQPGHLGYNPAVSGLNLNYNRVHFEWKKNGGKYKVTMDARTAKYRPEVSLASMTVVDRRGPVFTYANGGQTERWTVAKSALGKGGSRWLPVRQPELYAGEVFQIFARSHGLILKAPSVGYGSHGGTVLVDRASPDLKLILKGMLKHSNNLTAEVMGLSASVARGHTVSGLSPSARQMSGWMETQLGARRPRFVDHSGLGDKSRITSLDMVKGMVSVGPNSILAGMLKPIQPRDGKGNLRLGSDITLKAKTGTLNFVSGLSGFINTGENKDLVFAIFSADTARRNDIALADRERPRGARSWSRRARALQWALIDRWVDVYG